MKTHVLKGSHSRRRFLIAASAAVTAAAAGLPRPSLGAEVTPTQRPLRIGVIGSGRIGGAVGTQWARAGHEVFFSSRHPEQLGDLVKKAGAKAQAGTPEQAAKFGEVVLLAVPYSAMPQISKDYAALLRGKVLLDAGNPFEQRDGAMAKEALAKGAGIATAEFLPGARIVRAFNAIRWDQVEIQANRPGEKWGIALAGDDAEALQTAAQLVRDAGFDPVVVGGLARGREFDIGAVRLNGMTAREIKQALKLP